MSANFLRHAESELRRDIERYCLLLFNYSIQYTVYSRQVTCGDRWPLSDAASTRRYAGGLGRLRLFISLHFDLMIYRFNELFNFVFRLKHIWWLRHAFIYIFINFINCLFSSLFIYLFMYLFRDLLCTCFWFSCDSS